MSTAVASLITPILRGHRGQTCYSAATHKVNENICFSYTLGEFFGIAGLTIELRQADSLRALRAGCERFFSSNELMFTRGTHVKQVLVYLRASISCMVFDYLEYY